jgi:peptidoglycan/xylan/chitin deacetylase (PgdA/CDA1 family)
MKLRAGLIRTHPVWEALLDQEGFPWKEVSLPGDLDLEDYSIVIAGDVNDGEWEEALKSYVREGGAIILRQERLARWIGGRRRWEKYKYLLPGNNSLLRGNRVIEMRGTGLVVESGELLTEKGHRVLPFVPFGHGVATAFPFEVERCIKDFRANRRLFYSPIEPLPSERVSLVPRGDLRMLIHSMMEAMHHFRKRAYAHLWYYPGDCTNVFGLRVDTDYSNREDVLSLYLFIKGLNLPASWFLHVKAHVGWIRDFQKMEGQEIGIHCYGHEEYGRKGSGRYGIEKARNLLGGLGISPEGFAAPYGVWKEELPVDLELMGFGYSSEFGYDYDNLPLFPWVMGGFSPVLHIPVHPVTIGNLKRCGYGELDMNAYFEAVVRRKLAVNEPLLFYCHPGDGHFNVLENLSSHAEEWNLRNLTFGEYAGWWKERSASLKDLVITVEDDTIEIGIGENDYMGEIKAAVVEPGGKRSLVDVGERVDAGALDWKEAPELFQDPGESTAVLGRRGWRLVEDLRTYIWRRRG